MKASEIMAKYRKDPFVFIKDMWKLTPQQGEFIKGENITWQQCQILEKVKEGINDEGLRRISIRSGRGIGKTACLSWIIIWFLFCFKESNVPCTAPTADQMYDCLWKEASVWINEMPVGIKEQFLVSTSHIRMKDSPGTWFARARTGRKETPEALAGMHADNLLMCVDEASGIPETIYTTAEGVITNQNYLVILISNPTRPIGYFHATQTDDKEAQHWARLNFSATDSPVVQDGYIERMADKYGEDSDEYRVHVLGQFPRADAIDDKGFVPLLTEEDLNITEDDGLVGERKMGVDPAGEGSNATRWIVRDRFKAVIVATEKKSTPKSIAQKTLTLMEYYKVKSHQVYVDSFGVGSGAIQELALAGAAVQGINVGISGDALDDQERFINLRAEAFYRIKDWLSGGGELYRNNDWNELLTLRFKRNLKGKIQIMSKDIMRREGYQSPDVADALMLTFTEFESWGGEAIINEEQEQDIYSPL